MAVEVRSTIVICHWVGRSTRRLFQLLDQMSRVDAGVPFDLMIVVNGGDEHPITLPERFQVLKPQIRNRENVGYNLMAWEHGWRATESEFYLFLQDECFLKRPGWLAEFEFRMSRDAGVGLLGEEIMWDRMTWSFLRESTDRDLGRTAWPLDEPIHPIDTYKNSLESQGIPIGEVGEHLCSLILFSSRAVLEQIGGFPYFGPSYRDAISSEVAISRIIAAHGYRISRVKNSSFAMIGHHQWTKAYDRKMKWRGRARAVLVALGLKKPR